MLEPEDVVVCSGSGVSGAGRKASIPLLFCECNESFHAYGVPKHRHLSEIEQELSHAAGETVVMSFTPHLIPVNTGICSTITAKVKRGRTPNASAACWKKLMPRPRSSAFWGATSLRIPRM